MDLKEIESGGAWTGLISLKSGTNRAPLLTP
jgi:hypothetical protein